MSVQTSSQQALISQSPHITPWGLIDKQVLLLAHL